MVGGHAPLADGSEGDGQRLPMRFREMRKVMPTSSRHRLLRHLAAHPHSEISAATVRAAVLYSWSQLPFATRETGAAQGVGPHPALATSASHSPKKNPAMSPTLALQVVHVLIQAGVQRIYGVVGDSLNPLVDAIRRTPGIEGVHVRNEEAGALAAAAEAEIC